MKLMSLKQNISLCLIPLLLLTCMGVKLNAQNNIDSLKLIINDNISSANDKAVSANLLSSIYVADSGDSTLIYNKLAKKYANEAGNEREAAYAEIIYGAVNTTKWSLDSLVDYYEKIRLLDVVQAYPELEAMIETDLARAYHFRGEFEESIAHSLMALKLNEALGRTAEIAKIGYNLGVVYYGSSQYELAIDKFKKGVSAYQKLGIKVFEAYCLNGIANAYINMNQLDSALFYTLQVRKLADETKNTVLQAVSRTAVATIKGEQKEYEEALKEYKDAIPYLESYGNQIMIATCYCNIAAAHNQMDEVKEAKIFIDKAYDYEILNDNPLADDLCLKIRAMVYEKLGEFEEATKYYASYIEYQDSVLLKENKLVIAELEEKYESSKKEAELQSQAAEINQRTYQRNMLFGGMGLSILFGGSIIWGLISRSNRNKKIVFQEKDLQIQKIQNLEKEKKLLSMSSLLEGQETERIRIAKDLHDGLGGLLTNVKAHFGKIQAEIEKVENLDIYKTANLMIDKAHDEVRRISHNLMPADLRVGGLPVAVRQLVHELKTIHDMDTDFELVGFTDERIEEKIELSSYRIIQELVNNTLKYADASKMFIQLSRFQDEIQIIVEDNGKGFDYEMALSKDGLGLKSIQSRVEQLQGHLDVDTGRGKGTSVTVNIPV